VRIKSNENQKENEVKTCIVMTALLFVCIFSEVTFAESNDPFAGKMANCMSEGPVKSEKWRFVGFTKEYTKEFSLVGSTIQQKGTYSYSNGKLTIKEYKKGTKEFEKDRIFMLPISLNSSGFEYMWKSPNGDIPYTCTWQK